MKTGPIVLLLIVCVGSPSLPSGARAQYTESAVEYLERFAGSEDVDEEMLDEIESLLESPIDLNTASESELARIPGLTRSARAAVQRVRKRRRILSWKQLEEVLADDPDALDALKTFAIIDRISPGERARRSPSRLDAYVTTQVFVRRENLRGYTSSEPLDHSLERRFTTRISIRNEHGFGGRLTFSRGSASVSPRLGGARANLLGGRLVATGGAISAGFGSGLVLARDGMRDPWQYASGRSPTTGFIARPRVSTGTDGGMLGGSLKLDLPSALTFSILYASRRAGSRDERLVGASAELSGDGASVGLLVLTSRLSPVQSPTVNLHELRRFARARWQAASVYATATLGSSAASMELALAAPGVAAIVASVTHPVLRRGRIALLLRHVPSRFPLLHGRPVVVGASDGTGETGLLTAASFRAGSWLGRMVLDVSRDLWASSSASWPEPSTDVRFELERRWRGAGVLVRFVRQRSPSDRESISASGRLSVSSGMEKRTGIRIQTDLGVNRALTFRLRTELSRTENADRETGTGALLYEQFRWRPSKRLMVEVRNVSFGTTSSDARLYVHETDVLYQPVLSVLSGDGFRRYLRVRVDLNDHFTLEGKVGALARETFPESTASLPLRAQRLDIRVQLRVRP